MIQYVFIPKRNDRKNVHSKPCYSGRYKLDTMLKPVTVQLHTTDKRIAQEKLQAIVDDLQREEAGIVMPRAIRDAAVRPLREHLETFTADLQARGRSKKYVENVKNWITRLLNACGWEMAKDVTPHSFIAWRSGRSAASKTLNEHLNAINALLNWMQRTGLLLANPLLSVGKVETRGREKRIRRALTDDEVQRLLNVSPRRRVVYLTALLTGLRRAELKALRWGDVHLDAPRPFLSVRASTTKNHKAATLFLRDDLAHALRAQRPPEVSDAMRVFRKGVPRMRTYRADLVAAGIAYEDSQGRRADFHALRHTLATNLSRSGVAPRVAMELMRHSDMRLTAKTYTDAALLPIADALDKLPRYQVVQEELQATGTDGRVALKIDAQIDAQLGVRSGPVQSQPVAGADQAQGAQTLEFTGDSQQKSPVVASCQQAKTDDKSGRGRIRTYVGMKPTGLQPVPFGRSGTRPWLDPYLTLCRRICQRGFGVALVWSLWGGR
jgi:integrase